MLTVVLVPVFDTIKGMAPFLFLCSPLRWIAYVMEPEGHSRIARRRNEKMSTSIVVSFPVLFKTPLLLTVSNVSSMDVIHF